MYSIATDGTPLPLWRLLFTFDGRASRAPFNYTILALFILKIAVSVGAAALSEGDEIDDVFAFPLLGFFALFYYIDIAVGAKRCHDTGRSGWLQLIYLLPIFNLGLVLYLMFHSGDKKANEYGPYPPGGTEEEAAEGAETGETPSGDASAAEPVSWPPSFANVLFSFKGRITRSVFWLRGAVPIILLFVIVQGGLLVGGSAILGGDPYPKGGLFPGGFTPSVDSEFQEAGDKITGTVTADTGPARVELELTAAKTTERITKTAIVGARTLHVTAARKDAEDPASYEVDFDWQDYPAQLEAEKPASIGQMVFLGVQYAVLLLFFWMLFAIAVKRYHDHDSSGWWSVLGLVPFFGQLGLLVSLGILKGKEGDNRFGPDPRQAEGAS